MVVLAQGFILDVLLFQVKADNADVVFFRSFQQAAPDYHVFCLVESHEVAAFCHYRQEAIWSFAFAEIDGNYLQALRVFYLADLRMLRLEPFNELLLCDLVQERNGVALPIQLVHLYSFPLDDVLDLFVFHQEQVQGLLGLHRQPACRLFFPDKDVHDIFGGDDIFNEIVRARIQERQIRKSPLDEGYVIARNLGFGLEIKMAEVRSIASYYNLIFIDELDLLYVSRVEYLVVEPEIGHRKGLLINAEEKEAVGDSSSHDV